MVDDSDWWPVPDMDHISLHSLAIGTVASAGARQWDETSANYRDAILRNHRDVVQLAGPQAGGGARELRHDVVVCPGWDRIVAAHVEVHAWPRDVR